MREKFSISICLKAQCTQVLAQDPSCGEARARKVIFIAVKKSWISKSIHLHHLKLPQSQANLKCHSKGHHRHPYHPPSLCQRELSPLWAENAAAICSATLQGWKQRLWFPNETVGVISADRM